MTCDEALELLSAALDGELSPTERNTLDAHLAECPGCAALFDQLAGQSRLLRDLECEVPDGLSERILSGLPGQAPARRGRVIHWRRWGTLAACLALVVWAGFALPQSAKNAAPQADLTSAVPENQAEENLNAISAPTSFDESPDPAAFSLEPREASGGDTAAGEPSLKTASAAGVQYLRVTWRENSSQPAARLLDSADDLAGLLAQYPQNDLTAETAGYDEEYFETASLVAVTLTENSGSVSHQVEDIRPTEGGYEIVISRQVPEIGTCDMAAWLILIETDGSITGQDTLTVTTAGSRPSLG